MEPNEFYVYPGTYFMCGGCGSSLAPLYPQTGRWRYKVYCSNQACSKYLIIFELGQESRIPVFDTGERAPDPRELQNQAMLQVGNTTRTMAGGMPNGTGVTIGTEVATAGPLPNDFTLMRL